MRTLHPLTRPGMTLFSLLLVLSVAGMLTALLFPAVLKIRAAAARTRCQSNLRQIVIASHNYANANNDMFPKDGGEGKKSWQWEIREYIEQGLNDGSQPVNLFYSPTRRPAKIYNEKAKTDYAGNGGTADDPAKPGKDDSSGLFGGVTFNDIKDGTSNTLYAGVKGLRTTDYPTGKGAGDKTSWHEGAIVDRIRSSNGDKRPPSRDADADNERGFGAPTEKICNFVLCDGAVRPIKYDIDAKIFQALITHDAKDRAELPD